MMEMLTASQNQAFAVALVIMLVIAMIEGVATVMGAGLSGMLDALVPEMDIDLDIEGPDAAPSSFTRLLGWLRLGEVPVLMLLVIFLTAFGLSGLVLQSFAHTALGMYLPGWIAVLPAVLVSLPTVRVLGGVLGWIMPKDETEAVAESQHIEARHRSRLFQIDLIVIPKLRRALPHGGALSLARISHRGAR